MILLIDNYDSFVHNLARYLAEAGVETRVVRNDALSIDEIRDLAPQAIILSPGPCTPAESGVSREVVRELGADIPILGVCLGHQVIAEALGGRVVRSDRPVHGQASWIHHGGQGLLEGLASPFQAGRYHSLVVDATSLPDDLVATAWTDDGLLMALVHRTWPVHGVQFHPESVLTPQGRVIIDNFLRLAGIEHDSGAAQLADFTVPQSPDDFFQRDVDADATVPLPQQS
jgi:anthranilate synthase/aminodeoxychorismate synthase-like glutamine amidotransferase